MKKIKVIAALLVLTTLVFTFAACSKAQSDGTYPDVPPATLSPSQGSHLKNDTSAESSDSFSGILSSSADRKLIYYVSIEYDVDDAAKSVDAITAKVAEHDGYVESSSLSGSNSKRASLVVRIPVAKVDAFLGGIAVVGDVVNKTITSEDVTARLETIEDKLAELNGQLTFYRAIDTTGFSLAEQMTVYDKITSLEAQIKTNEDKRDSLSARVDYTTISITLYQDYVAPVVEKETFGAKLWRNLKESLASVGDVFKFIVNAVVVILPYAVIIGVIVTVVVVIRRKTGKARPKPTEIPEAHPSDEENPENK